MFGTKWIAWTVLVPLFAAGVAGCVGLSVQGLVAAHASAPGGDPPADYIQTGDTGLNVTSP